MFTAGVGNAVASTDLVCDLIAKVIFTAHDATQQWDGMGWCTQLITPVLYIRVQI